MSPGIFETAIDLLLGSTDPEQLRDKVRQGQSIARQLRRALMRRCEFQDERVLKHGPADIYFDELIELRDEYRVELPFREDQIGYIAASVEAVLRMLEHIPLSKNDLICDVGSGPGRVPVLVHLLTDLPTMGIELDTELANQADELVKSLQLKNVTLTNDDATRADLSRPNIFLFNLPFDGRLLQEFLINIRPTDGSTITLYPYNWHLAFWDIDWLKAIKVPGTHEQYYFVSK